MITTRLGIVRAFSVGLSILLVLTLIPLGERARASTEAELGFSLGEVLLRWNLVSSGLASAGDESVSRPLDNSLAGLEESLDSAGFSALGDRVEPLRSKLEAAKEKGLWTIQLGYWSFSEEDPSVRLSGAERGFVNEEARFRSYRYLAFLGGDARAVIDLAEKSLKVPLEAFTVEVWVNPDEGSSGSLVRGKDWELALRDGAVELELPGGSVHGESIEPGRWSHLAVVTDGKSAGLYRNGLLVVESDLPEPAEIGSELELGSGFVGRLDELRVKPRAVEPEVLNFDRPLDYLLGFPVISRANESFGDDGSWHFYAGLLLSSLTVKEESGVAAVRPEDLTDVSDFLLGEEADLPSPPDGVPESVLSDLEQLGRLGETEELSGDKREEVAGLVDELVSYLDSR